MTESQTWTGYASWDEGQQHWEHFGHALFVKAYGGVPEEVTLTETTDGPYWGFLRNPIKDSLMEPDQQPSLVYYRKALFDICFPYGADTEEAKGNGRVIRLDIARTSDLDNRMN
jgi:hypothetical protein